MGAKAQRRAPWVAHTARREPHTAGGASSAGTAACAAGAIGHPRGVTTDLVERRVDEVGELDLGGGKQTVEGHPDRHADEP